MKINIDNAWNEGKKGEALKKDYTISFKGLLHLGRRRGELRR